MNSKKTVFIILLILVLLVGGASVLYSKLGQTLTPEQLSTQPTPSDTAQDTSSDGETVPKTIAPDFTVYDIDGNEVHLSDYLGKPVGLNFWASWCGPCKMEMPEFQEKYRAL